MKLNRHPEICSEIRSIFGNNHDFLGRLGDGGDGEWLWIRENYRQNSLAGIAVGGDFSAVCQELAGFPLSKLSYGMVTFSEEEGLRGTDELGPLSTGAWKDFFLLQRLLKRGNHLSVVDWQKLLRVDLPGPADTTTATVLDDSFRHTYFASLVLELAGSEKSIEVTEVGGGYGGLALQIQRLRPSDSRVRHCIIDLPESLLLSYWFLRMQGQTVAVLLEDSDFDRAGTADIILVPDYLSERIPWAPDVFFNSRSLSEMQTETSSEYLSQIERVLKPPSVVLEATGYDLFPNSTRHRERLAGDLIKDLPSYRLTSSNWSPWQGGGGRYFEYVLRRA